MSCDQALQEEVGVKQVNELPSRGRATELKSGQAKEATQVCLLQGSGSLPRGRDPSSRAATPGRAEPRDGVNVES